MNGKELPLISIIVPVYNTEKYLDRCISSIMNQTYTNIEIVLVDDGSKDDSLKICNKFALIDERIRVFHKENGGVSSARNLGIDNSNGEYISYVDSDDYIHPQFIEILYWLISCNDADISQCVSLFVKNEKKKYKQYKYGSFYSEVIDGPEGALRCVRGRQMLAYCISCSKLFSRNVVKELRFDYIYNAEDIKYSYQAMLASRKIAVCEVDLYFYSKRAGSATTGNIDLSSNIISVFDDYENDCKEIINDPDRMRLYYEGANLAKIDSVVEDYWQAYRLNNEERKKEVISLFEKYKTLSDEKGYPLTFKIKAFDFSPRLYILLRTIYRLIYLS